MTDMTNEAWVVAMLDLGSREDTPELDDLTQQELADLWAQIDQHATLIASAKKKVEAALLLIAEGPLVTADHRVLKVAHSVSRTGWRKPALVEAIVASEARYLVDPDGGETVQALPVKALGFFEPTTAPTKLLALGIDHREFCVETWTDRVQVVT